MNQMMRRGGTEPIIKNGVMFEGERGCKEKKSSEDESDGYQEKTSANLGIQVTIKKSNVLGRFR